MQRLIELENKIGYHFKKKELLLQALTHSSFAVTADTPSYERLEFLGDAVLNVLTAIYVFDKANEKDEAFLTDLKSAYVNRNFLQEVGVKLELQKLVRAQGLTTYRLDQVVESIIGAMYLDGGFRRASRFVKRYILSHKISPLIDYKNTFKAVAWERYKAKIHYVVERETGRPHEKVFYVRAHIDGMQVYGKGKGFTKKEAEINAARDILEKLDKPQS